jgi:hypothetical protein
VVFPVSAGAHTFDLKCGAWNTDGSPMDSGTATRSTLVARFVTNPY